MKADGALSWAFGLSEPLVRIGMFLVRHSGTGQLNDPKILHWQQDLVAAGNDSWAEKIPSANAKANRFGMR
jgi:hypothetical protein